LERLEDRTVLSTVTFTVNSLGDTGSGSGTMGDLRYCITQADKGPASNTYIINLTSGTITLESALMDLTNNITIQGTGANTSTVQRDSAKSSFGIFRVDAGKKVSLSSSFQVLLY
jgi:hypothetical protein